MWDGKHEGNVRKEWARAKAEVDAKFEELSRRLHAWDGWDEVKDIGKEWARGKGRAKSDVEGMFDLL